MEEQLINLKNEVLAIVWQTKNLADLENLKIKYLGKRGQLTLLLKELPKLEVSERKRLGLLANDVKRAVEQSILQTKEKILGLESKQGYFDVTKPGIRPPVGHLHLISQTINEISFIFEKAGFTRVTYPEVEWDWYAFEGLNMAKGHPARDEWETFFVDGLTSKKYGVGVLTPHTSSGQLREMQRVKKTLPAGRQAPIKMLNIAKCYRRQSDVSHAPMFYQFEGLVIDKGINITHLKGTLDYFAKEYFGPDRKTRIRPFHFQFTEPSFEVDVTCLVCGGKGCRACKQGWMELGGAGMVHPIVLQNGGINPDKYTGFAFGWGVERVLMMKYGIPDIRLLFSGDLRFLNQF